MITISMDKNVTIMKELNKFMVTKTITYKELEKELKNAHKIVAIYPFGMRKRRNKLLKDMGFSMKETIYFNNEAIHSKIKEVWTRCGIETNLRRSRCFFR